MRKARKKVEQNLYYIYKIPSNKIQNLTSYSFKEARENGDIVAIGDNLVISQIQKYHKINKSPSELFNEVEEKEEFIMYEKIIKELCEKYNEDDLFIRNMIQLTIDYKGCGLEKAKTMVENYLDNRV